MDIVSSASAVVGLVFNFATAAKTCKAIRGRYKDAALTIDSIRQELETLQAALQQLANLMMHDASALTSQWDSDQSLSGTFTRSMRGFERTIKQLQAELDKLKFEKEVLSPLDKASVVWNEDRMREHLGRLRSQAGALQLLLHVLQVGAVSEVKRHVKNLEAALIRAAVGSSNDNLDESKELISNRSTFLDGQEDLLDLAWSEKDSGEVSANQELQSAHLVLLQEAFAAEGDGTSETKSISSTTSPPTEAIIGDIRNPFQDFRSPPASLQPDEQETAELEADLTASEEATSEFNVDPIDDQAVNDEPVPKLISAVMRGDLERIIELLDCAHDIESFHPENRRTGVIFATFLDYFDVLKCLLERGANIAAQDKDGRTALHFAASEGTYRCAELLLASGAAVDTFDYVEEVPLHRASRYGKTKIVKLLLPYYSDPLALLERQRRNALHLAVHFDRIDIIELICRYIKKSRHFTGCRAEDDEQTNVGEGCDCPIYYPHLEDIDAFGDTALQMGVIGPFRQAVSTLLQFSLPQLDTPMRKEKLTPEFLIAQKPLFWRRPLHHAIIHADTHGDMYKTLVDGGADIRLPDCKGQTPLMVAMRDKNEEATQFLRGIKSTTRGVPYNKLFLF